MSETRDAFGPLLAQLQAEMRSVKRDLAMIQAQQSELPTLVQFQSGLTSLDARMTELHQETQRDIAAVTAMVQQLLKP